MTGNAADVAVADLAGQGGLNDQGVATRNQTGAWPLLARSTKPSSDPQDAPWELVIPGTERTAASARRARSVRSSGGEVGRVGRGGAPAHEHPEAQGLAARVLQGLDLALAHGDRELGPPGDDQVGPVGAAIPSWPG